VLPVWLMSHGLNEVAVTSSTVKEAPPALPAITTVAMPAGSPSESG
jgi:hypothetical protein